MRAIFLCLTALWGAAALAAPNYDFTPVTQQVDALVTREALDGASLIVIQNGAPIYEHYFGSYTADTRVSIASASKWLSAIAIERLVEKGQMQWSNTVGTYFPSAPAATQAITLGQLFSHTSGMQTDDAPCLYQPLMSLDTCARNILALPLAYTPGSAFAYTGNAMQVGGRMAEIASGKTWDQLFQDEVITPLQMPGTDYAAGLTIAPYVHINNPMIAGGVRSVLHDYAHVVQMISQRGQWNGAAFLDAAGVAAMQTDQTHGAPAVYSPDPLANGYGYGEWRNRVDDTDAAIQVSSTGKFGTSPWVDNQYAIAAVLLIKSDYSRIVPDLRQLWANVRTVVAAQDLLFGSGFDH